MKVLNLQRETEKMQWMNEMRMQMTKEQHESKGAPQQTTAAKEKEILQLSCARTNLVNDVKLICKDFAASSAGKKCKLTCRSLVDEIDANIDFGRLEEALTILLGNSVRFSPGNCQINVNLGRVGKDKAVIQVADNGIGIRDEFKATAFEPMLGSEGIGLDRVKDIVVAHGGTIRLEDNPGGGTVFVITLPVEAEVEVEEAVLMDDE